MKISCVTKTSPPSPIQGLETSTQDGGWARTTERSSNRCISIMDLQLGGRAPFGSFQIVFTPSCQTVYLIWEEMSKLLRNLQSLRTTTQSIHRNSNTCIFPFERCIYWSENPFKQQNTIYISSGNEVYNHRFLRLPSAICACLVYLHLSSLMATQARPTFPGTFKQASCFSLFPGSCSSITSKSLSFSHSQAFW